MTKAGNSYSRSDEVKKEVNELSSQIQTLAKIASTASVGGIAIGAVVAVCLGPIAFVVGTSIAMATNVVVKAYAATRKKEINSEVVDLNSKHIISDNEASKLKEEIALIYSDSPK